MSKTTQERILDAAELLCAERGIKGTSIRAITQAASANIAAVNFHFGGKAGLIEAMFKRRLEPLADKRLKRLEAAQTAAAGKPVPAAAVLDAFMEPLLELVAQPDRNARAFASLFARTVVEPTDAIRKIFGTDLTIYSETFLTAFQTALPHLDRMEAVLRLDFAIGAIAHALSDPTRRAAFGVAPDPQELQASLRTFLLAGLEAPSNRKPKAS